MDVAEGKIKRGRKFDQVLEGAREIFMRDGFEGASVDDIARAAGVSKATLYSYFPDKRLLFMEVATGQCQRQAEECIQSIDPNGPPREVLRKAAERMMRFYLSDFGQAVFRIVVAETARFPGLGREFWEDGPARSREVLIAYFREATARGTLRVEDPGLAADQFTELCKVDLHPRMLMGLGVEAGPAERARVAEGAVEMFLARYGT
ncbi:TetR/AcrR family transcriptional regulator [Tropicimonas sp. IMCC6043]|uniref:TetR/AcrR family transcriptional regulator n=1 Tax=Tropicimonas sp. IMCC6043 TaxID=2510645 RepID=UPI00101C7CB5|nr:TetR/AcrR family transcriptional regulator [Tropicimonas sp. IMCC6043]RYH10951.1 TetR/AcrR family transcriptional regulator [Tropicimonas sp. IMCC6043]